MRLYVDQNNSLISSAKREGDNFYDVECITLKQILEKNNLTKVDLVKIDIEGMEYELIENLEDDIENVENNFFDDDDQYQSDIDYE